MHIRRRPFRNDKITKSADTVIMAPSNLADVGGDPIGPHPSYIEIAKPYVFESKIRESLHAAAVSEAKDDGIRLQGVAWIDSVRKALAL